MVREWSRDELIEHLKAKGGDDPSYFNDACRMINKWLVRGDGAAIYQNELIGASPLDTEIVSFGSPKTQLETESPPSQMPDIGNRINWRYWLAGTYRGEQL